MATIPDYQTNTVHNSDLPASRFSANASADSFGGADAEALGRVAQGASNLGGSLLDIGLTEQDKTNHDVARGQVNSARLELNQYAQSEYAKAGSDAFGASQRIQAQAQKIQEKYNGALTTSAQQDIFKNAFTTYSDEHVMRAQNFEQEQKKVYRSETLNQASDIDSQDIQAHMNDPAFVSRRLFDIEQNVKAEYAGHGDVAMRADKVVQSTLMNVISETAMTDPNAALMFLDAHEDKLGGKAQVRSIRDYLEKKEFDLRKADIVMGETARPGATREEVIKNIQATKLPNDQKEKVIRDAMVQFDVVDAAKDKDKREKNESSWNSFYQSPDLKTIANLPIDATEKDKMTETLSKMTKQKTNEEYAQNLGQIQRLSTDEFLKLNLEEVKYDISPYNYDRLKKEQAELRKTGKEKTPGFTKAIADETAEAKELSLFKIDEKKDSDVVKGEKQQKLNQYIGEYSEKLSQVPDEKRNDPDVRAKVRNALLKEKINKGWFWDSPSGQYDYTPHASEGQPVTRESVLQNNSMPDKQKAAFLIRDDLKARKITPEQARQKLQAIGYQYE